MISIVTVAMNRTEHLQKQACAVSLLRDHVEHIILDFGTTPPIKRDQLPSDKRIQLHRIDSPGGRWWLTHAYNLAFALAVGDYVIKLDADVLPSQRFMNLLLKQQAATNAHLMCNRLTLQDWSLPTGLFITNGLFLCKKVSLSRVRGFNPYIQGWGWDEIDLYSRLFLAGFSASRLPQDGLESIQHENEIREHPVGEVNLRMLGLSRSMLHQVDAETRMLAQNEKNRRIALASIVNNIKWPSFEDYRKAYQQRSSLPSLFEVCLFDEEERRSLSIGLIRRLLKPSRMQHFFWCLASRFGSGPYAISNSETLLRAFNIQLDLVL